MGDHPPLDIDRVVEVLDRNQVQYLLVGGVATRFHGSERLTELEALQAASIERDEP